MEHLHCLPHVPGYDSAQDIAGRGLGNSVPEGNVVGNLVPA